jgi:hypothetical protein
MIYLIPLSLYDSIGYMRVAKKRNISLICSAMDTTTAMYVSHKKKKTVTTVNSYYSFANCPATAIRSSEFIG